MKITRHSTNLIQAVCIVAVGAALPASARAQCADWRTETGVRRVGGVTAMTLWDPDGAGPQSPVLVVAGQFDHVGGVNGIAAANIATWNGSVWTAMPGLDGDVFALAVLPSGELVAAGGFFVGGAQRRIARWTGTSWEPLGFGANSAVYALVVLPNGDLVAGGAFTVAGGIPANYIARWGATGWSAFPAGGMNGFVTSLVYRGSQLIAGGAFTTAGGISCSHIAAWTEGSPVWQQLDAGVDDNVAAMTVMPNGDLIAGGFFRIAGGSTVNSIARWNGTSWSALGTGMSGGPNGYHSGVKGVRVLANGELVAAGYFTAAGGVPASHIARWNGSTWMPLALGIGNLGNPAYFWDLPGAMMDFDGELFVGGGFANAGRFQVESLARWNGTDWLDIPGVMITNVTNGIFTLAPWAGSVVLGGTFFGSAINATYADYLLWWDGANLRSLGQPDALVDASTTAPATGGTTDLVIGGDFTSIDGTTCNFVARRNDTLSPNWQPMGAGFNNSVAALERVSNSIVAGGIFTLSASTTVNRVAVWNESAGTWSPMQSGMNGAVWALKYFVQTDPPPFPVTRQLLVAGGSFTTAGGATANRIAFCEQNQFNGSFSSWAPMGQGFNNAVYSIVRFNGSTYAAGLFTASGATPLNHIARWNGTAWVDVGGGTNVEIDAMTVSNGTLVVGGFFTTAGGVTARHLARWNGTSWSEIGGGTSDAVHALAVFQNEIQVGGRFISVRNATLESPYWARFAESGTPWIAKQPASQNVGCGASVTLSIQPAEGYSGLTYQWRKNGTPIVLGPTGTGSTISSDGPSLSISNVSEAEEGNYDCVLSNACGSSTSAGATLTISSGNAGDADGDGNGLINGADIAGFIQTIMGGSFGRGLCAYDMNADGVVDMADLSPFVDLLLSNGLRWSLRFPISAPLARAGNVMAYDAGRGVSVLFGGQAVSQGPSNETWEWNGTNWAQRFPASAPSARWSHSTAYDSGRGVTVLFGGYVGNNINGETWEWNGTNWLQRFPATTPSPHRDHAMAFDAGRGVTVLFGGTTSSGMVNETWEWNGTNWSQRFPATAPSSRDFHAMAYDSGRGVTVLFGGRTSINDLNNETWEWNGTNWSQRSPAAAPSLRYGHAIVYDSGRAVTLLFGGNLPNFGFSNETWEWNGTIWSQQVRASGPAARAEHTMAYDAGRGATVLFGGQTSDFSLNNQTWEWRGGN